MPKINRVLVTGSTGFVGKNVQRLWSDIVCWPKGVDLTDASLVEETVLELLSREPFDGVLHLAAQASPQRSLEHVELTWRVNVMGTLNLTEALTKANWQGRFLYVSTGAVYGGRNGLGEQDLFKLANSPYVASKLAAEVLVSEWGRRSTNEVLIARPFNHSGLGQSNHYFLPSMAAQIASLPAEGGVIEVGNLDAQRDFLHVEDLIKAYRALLERGRGQEVYNLASGRSVGLRELLQGLVAVSGRKVEFRVSEERYREECPDAIPVDITNLIEHTGWQVECGLDRMVEDVMREWMDKACQK